jgi:hypothetical protein
MHRREMGPAHMMVVAVFVAATGVLARVAEERWSVTLQWRRLGFFVALFYFWYLAPATAESRVLARVIELLHP